MRHERTTEIRTEKKLRNGIKEFREEHKIIKDMTSILE